MLFCSSRKCRRGGGSECGGTGSCLGDIWGSGDSLGAGFNDSYSGDVVLGKRRAVELCLTTTGAEQSEGVVTAG